MKLLGATIALAVLISGCIEGPSGGPPTHVGQATYLGQSGEVLTVSLQAPEAVLAPDGTWMQAWPLIMTANASGATSVYWLDDQYTIVRNDSGCVQMMKNQCVQSMLRYGFRGDVAPLGVGIEHVQRPMIGGTPVAQTVLQQQDSGQSVRVLSEHRISYFGHDVEEARFVLDGVLFPAEVSWRDSQGGETKWTRIAVSTSPTALRAQSWDDGGRDALVGRHLLFPGDEMDDLDRGFAHSEPFEALLKANDEATRMFDEGCVIGTRQHPVYHDPEPQSTIPPLTRETDTMTYVLADSDGAVARWSVHRTESLDGRSEYKVAERNPPKSAASCDSHPGSSGFAISSTSAIQWFYDLDLRYQHEPEFAWEYRDVDPRRPGPLSLFEVRGVPDWVDLSQPIVGYNAHTLRVETATGLLRAIYMDPADHESLGRASTVEPLP